MRPFIIDFVNGAQGYRRRQAAGKNQLIARACGIKQGQARPHILDACAGFGYDAMTLANLGCRLTLLEHHPVVAALLQDALRRLADHDPLLGARLKLFYNSADDFLQNQQQSPVFSTQAPLPKLYNGIITSANDSANKSPAQLFDVIYLDPMFPASCHGSALVKKEMQILRHLTCNQSRDYLKQQTKSCNHHQLAAAEVADETAAAQLFSLAKAHCHRLVIKRPHTATALLSQTPELCYRQRQHRFDVYLQR